MGVYESLTREELVRKLLVQENLCHELQGKVGKLQEEIFQQAKNGESEGENEGDVCENVVVKRTEKFLADNVVRLSLMLEAGNVFPWFADIVSGKIEIGDELFKAYGVDRKEFHDDFFRMTTFIASIYPDDRGIFEAIYNSLLAGESCKIGLELRLDLLNTGEYKWVDLKGVAQEFDERGKVTKILGFIADIQKRRDDEQALIEAKQRAEESDRLKSAFLANVSHEIRTPLNAIVGFSEVIAHTESECEREEYLDIVKANSNLLLHLINDILDLSRIESGKSEMHFQQVEIAGLVDEVEKVHQLKMKLNVDLRVVRPQGEFWTSTDRNRVMQVLFNFLSNAIKNTETGSITLGLKQEGDWLKLFVSDTGCGIPEEKLPQIFTRFEKLNDFVQGTGLGLSICKSIVERLGGRIEVSSEQGQGSTFALYLPYQEIPVEVAERSLSTKIDSESVRHKKILVVEDIESNFAQLNILLKKEYTILWVRNGQEAINSFIREKPDLILMDIRMPVMDGIQATEKIRTISLSVPIIAVTAYAFYTEQQQAIQAGCNAVISKPYSLEKLKETIETYIG